ncbi:dibenzothiophene desulfurization enzyme [Pseudoclavibacter sp. AY1F1]|uniref:NtaA/DmoA family FMN-dependent monooxygenase n=1 Tax=Pseudoclavibacter sp. AY1F1 TaxID=2080583 RepID=UPI000CE8BBC6|nr:NtaA/DmoA family FMN-dependent monooxygenase [Pseudoclavibacter sp. AY1F1]PPF43968.1 dibenzothiophene desulfurization enzyme [Pseudoclavibacter sp. AY1F1]
MVNPPTQRFAAAWRHPDSDRDWLRAGFYVDIARLLERGGFDVMFMPDALAVPEDALGDVTTTLASGGKGAVTLDPITVLSAVAGATTRIGLGATVSTSFLPPYAIARTLASLDHLSGGRVAWNIVTSTTDAEARNMGVERIAPKSQRYARADRVVTQVLQLMESWAPTALVQDAREGVFADQLRVARTPGPREQGAAPGPLSLPRSPQGHPVLMQAGASPRGMEFAAKWAELVFVSADGLEGNRAVRSELRERARLAGRDPDELRVCAAIQPIAGSTKIDATSRRASLLAHIDEASAVRSLVRLMHADPAAVRLQDPAVDFLAEHRGATGSDGFEDMLAAVCRREAFTVRDLALRQSFDQLTPSPTGSGASIAEELCEWQDAGAADGFVVTPAILPGSLEDFVEHVVPELRLRGRLPAEGAPPSASTLRERLAAKISPRGEDQPFEPQVMD